MYKIPMLFCVALMISHATVAQKVKYKDIYPDLDSRKFNKVESDLTTFLANPKNDDHANAHYQMGLVVQAKFLLHDVLADTAELFQLGNTSIDYLTKSKSLVTEKEVKKNEGYYQAFYRRDLRTGDFGIKVSDVHLDIEEKVAAITKRLEAIHSLHGSVQELTDLELQMTQAFNELVGGADSFADYMMRSDLDAISKLGDMQALYRSFDEVARKTVQAGTDLEVEDYYKSVEYTTIEGFEPLTPIFADDNKQIKTYQFGEWASATKLALNDEVFALKEEIVDFDRTLVSANARLSIHQPADFPVSIPTHLTTVFDEYDKESVARRLLESRILENVVLQLSDTTLNVILLDSAAIEEQVQVSDSVLQACHKIQELLAFESSAIEEANAYYDGYFASSFDGVAGVKTYAQVTKNWASNMINVWDTVYQHWYLRNHYGFTPTDTISLRPFEESFVEDYLTKGFVEVAEDTLVSWGVRADTLLGFVAKFGVERTVIWEQTFATPLLSEEDELAFASDTIAAGEGAVTFYLYDEDPAGEIDISFINVDVATGEVKWVTDAMATRKPQFTVYTSTGKETTIFLYPQEEYPLPEGEVGYVVISEDGEIR